MYCEEILVHTAFASGTRRHGCQFTENCGCNRDHSQSSFTRAVARARDSALIERKQRIRSRWRRRRHAGQLKNALERVKVLADDGVIRLYDSPPEVASFRNPAPGGPGIIVAPAAGHSDDLAELERDHVLAILNREQGNKARADRALGIDRRTLYGLLEKHEDPASAAVVTDR